MSLKTFFWDSETLTYFRKLLKGHSLKFVIGVMLDFLEHDCMMEEGETIEDLFLDLLTQVLTNKNN